MRAVCIFYLKKKKGESSYFCAHTAAPWDNVRAYNISQIDSDCLCSRDTFVSALPLSDDCEPQRDIYKREKELEMHIVCVCALHACIYYNVREIVSSSPFLIFIKYLCKTAHAHITRVHVYVQHNQREIKPLSFSLSLRARCARNILLSAHTKPVTNQFIQLGNSAIASVCVRARSRDKWTRRD